MDRETVNDTLAYIVERYLYHSNYDKTSEIAEKAAKKMMDIELLEMWYLTQEFLR